MPPWWPQLLLHLPIAVFVFCFGACVGSFLNVVIYRLPAGMSVTTPSSRCPTCGAMLRFGRENLPILGWFLVRGRCRHCGVRISPQYMVIELLMAVAFVGFYLLFYTVPVQAAWWGEIGGPWWIRNGPHLTWPAFTAWMFLVAGLVAMTVIDARTFTIPIQIPLFVTITAFIAYPLQALLPVRAIHAQTWPIQAVCWKGFAIAAGGMTGIVLSSLMLRMGRLRYSFADYHEFLPASSGDSAQQQASDAGNVTAFELLYLVPVAASIVAVGFLGIAGGLVVGVCLAVVMGVWCKRTGIGLDGEEPAAGQQVLAHDYPHGRREMGVELKFLAPCVIGLVAGWLVGGALPDTPPPQFLQALGGSLSGYLVGGGLVWAIRILGTLGFGREAMGLGDVHLMAAIGAVLGWFDPILIFFIAPFSGILWALLSIGIAAIFKKSGRAIPYGPHLAVATLIMVLARPAVHDGWQGLMRNVPWPAPGLCDGDSGRAGNSGLNQPPRRASGFPEPPAR